MDKQFFKCHCRSQYCLFRWRPGSSTVWNMLMFVVIILTPSECFPPSWCIQGNPITLTCSRYCIENITKFKSVKIYSWIWLILIVYRYTLALKSFLVKIFFFILKAGLSLRKVNRHVDFPLILDLAPFCAASCKVPFQIFIFIVLQQFVSWPQDKLDWWWW